MLESFRWNAPCFRSSSLTQLCSVSMLMLVLVLMLVLMLMSVLVLVLVLVFVLLLESSGSSRTGQWKDM